MNATTSDEIEPTYSINKVHIEAPAQWLRRGWQDFKAAPGVSLVYGSIFTLIGVMIFLGLDALGQTYLILPLSGGFILFAPFLALGLYEVSRQLERDELPTFLSSYLAWKTKPGRLGILAFVLLVIMMVWTQVAVVLYALMMGDAALSLDTLLVDIFASTDGLVFLAFGTLIGMVFAAVTFLLTVVSVPMLLDQDIDVFDAMKVSYHTVSNNGHVMWSWAFTLGLLTWFALTTFFVGLIIVMPVLGYASWHAYRDLVDRQA